jgi:DNA-directed RNA polymerase sigma subunit (sigma70/sigma32)
MTNDEQRDDDNDDNDLAFKNLLDAAQHATGIEQRRAVNAIFESHAAAIQRLIDFSCRGRLNVHNEDDRAYAALAVAEAIRTYVPNTRYELYMHISYAVKRSLNAVHAKRVKYRPVQTVESTSGDEEHDQDTRVAEPADDLQFVDVLDLHMDAEAALSVLTARELRVVCAIYGLRNTQVRTKCAIAKKERLSDYRMDALLQRAMKKMRLALDADADADAKVIQ